jgi:hypothetical protein
MYFMPPKLEADIETRRMQLVAPATWFERVESWRAKQRPIPSKSEAVRILVDRSLDADKD